MKDLLNFKKILLEGAEFEFIGEIVGRTGIMFVIILIVLRLSGRRGVKQLTLFEVAIILGMGSAAGDPMFQEDIPVLYGIVVLFVTILVYKIVTWIASRSLVVHRLLEGEPMVVVRDGLFEIKRERDNDFSKMEFFAELRNQSVEHLGQVCMALMEADGTLSILFYPDDQVRYGLPLFPPTYSEIDPGLQQGPIACMHCGYWIEDSYSRPQECPRCKCKRWTRAIRTKRIV
ncbi:MAG TPA: DUF421 domain-containing protein [Sphingobacterium sp.]|nr:DUF421 domain-containing protein [Sphingobacterium sp.]